MQNTFVGSPKEKMELENMLNQKLQDFKISLENYPDLKANQNFLALQSQLEGTENRIAVARKDYIDSVKVFNTRIRTIPTKWIVALFSDMEKKATFDIEESKKEVPVVDFSK